MAKEVFTSTGCDGVMIARGAIQNPWIFQEIKHYLATGELLPSRSFPERVELMRKHLKLSVEYKGERKGVLEFRKHLGGYLRNYPNVSRLRIALMQCTDHQSILDALERTFDALSTGAEITPDAQLAA